MLSLFFLTERISNQLSEQRIKKIIDTKIDTVIYIKYVNLLS